MNEQMIQPQNVPASVRQGPFLIIGLGNPGRQYAQNRHNAGFMVLNRLSVKFGDNFSQVESKALVAKSVFQGERVLLAKPQTYMNRSGVAVSALVHFYQVQLEQVLVVYDDVDLPIGTLRVRPSGGSAGHKGMQSIIEKLGTEEIPRLRIGTGRPPGRKEAADYVLKDFPTSEQNLLDETLDRAVEAVLTFLHSGLERAMNAYNC